MSKSAFRLSSELHLQVIEDFDEHLLAGHGILMEDLPLERLQQFLEDPSIFEKGSRTVDEIRQQLYGRGRMPILAAEAQAPAPKSSRVRLCLQERTDLRRNGQFLFLFADTALEGRSLCSS